MSEKQGQIMSLIMTCMLVLSMIVVAKESAEFVSTLRGEQTNLNTRTVVIDAGHGGNDPGKVGINDALEKDVNLSIALKVKKYLEQQDVNVIMTREEDMGLYKESDTNKKVRDMKQRLSIIEAADPALVVSIHQNSYPEESVNGIQVFYYKDSIKSREAALIMQEQMIHTLKPEKEREAKDNKSYYLLKKTTVPIIIVECGFLSNTKEASKLVTPAYQEQVAWAIHLGILRYLNTDMGNIDS